MDYMQTKIFTKPALPTSKDKLASRSNFAFGYIFSKRGSEHVHVMAWVLKDLGWTRCWPIVPMAFIAIFVALWGAFQIVIDVICIVRRHKKYKASKNGSMESIISAYRELVGTVIQFLWILGNAVWSVYETWDLRHTAHYGEIYEIGLKYAIYPLYSSAAIGILYVFVTSVLEFFCIGPWYQARYDATLLSLAPTWELDSLTNETKAELDNEIVNANEKQRIRGLWHEESLGLPRSYAGFILTPAGKRDLFTGLKTTASRLRCVSGFYTFRDVELMILIWWCMKDFSWTLEATSFGIWTWIISAIGALTTCWRVFILMTVHNQGSIECVHSLCEFFWICANIVWGYGEMFLDDGLEEDTLGILELSPEDRFAYMVPHWFTKSSELPEAAWYFRFIASWILLSIVIFLGLFYCYLIIRGFINYQHNKKFQPTVRDAILTADSSDSTGTVKVHPGKVGYVVGAPVSEAMGIADKNDSSSSTSDDNSIAHDAAKSAY